MSLGVSPGGVWGVSRGVASVCVCPGVCDEVDLTGGCDHGVCD